MLEMPCMGYADFNRRTKHVCREKMSLRLHEGSLKLGIKYEKRKWEHSSSGAFSFLLLVRYFKSLCPGNMTETSQISCRFQLIIMRNQPDREPTLSSIFATLLSIASKLDFHPPSTPSMASSTPRRSLSVSLAAPSTALSLVEKSAACE
mmetsp:Transcript_46960/g.142208  ORF Transcript_46960/g.142208 Transcript_46960/m.142208 type:complete len:149 (+) Transcript_46960:154-600(+)